MVRSISLHLRDATGENTGCPSIFLADQHWCCAERIRTGLGQDYCIRIVLGQAYCIAWCCAERIRTGLLY